MTYWQVIAAVGVGSISVFMLSLAALVINDLIDDIRRMRK